MSKCLIYPGGTTRAIQYAARCPGLPLTPCPTPDTTHLLLDVPTRQEGVESILAQLGTVTVIGGNLNFPGYACLDLLKDEEYLAKNAALTARCALKLALPYLPVTLEGCPALVLGWGRIGKCLALLLKGLGAEVTVAVRESAHRAMAQALGCKAAELSSLTGKVEGYRLIYNTIPAKILSDSVSYDPECVAVELASVPALPGNVIDGRGLPGRLAPESSGRLIAETRLRRI